METRLRKEAQEIYNHGRDLYRAKKNEEGDQAFLKALKILDQIQKKQDDDLILMAFMTREIGTVCFNKTHYKAAEKYYTKSATYLDRIQKKTDENLREIIEVNINWCDCFLHLKNHPSAKNAFLKAINAFKNIEIKNEAELALGDVNNNLIAFRLFWEKETSKKHYLKNNFFKKQNQILQGFFGQSYQPQPLDVADADFEFELIKMFNDLTIGRNTGLSILTNQIKSINLNANPEINTVTSDAMDVDDEAPFVSRGFSG